jgi:hypothetical protein
LFKNWSPKDLLSTKHLLAEHRAIEEARIARNVTAGCWLPYNPGWTFIAGLKNPELNPYRLAIDEFETPDDKWSPGPAAKDYSDASEGTGQVTVRGSNYDFEEPEVFSPYDATVRYKNPEGGLKCKRRATADEEHTLGFDTESDLVVKMTDAVKAWAGMTTPPPKAADPTVEDLVKIYLANGGEIHTFGAYRTTPEKEIRINRSSRYASAWAGGTGIPREMRRCKRRFGVRPKTGSKQWSNTV